MGFGTVRVGQDLEGVDPGAPGFPRVKTSGHNNSDRIATILDSRTRKFGRDEEALAAQIKEKASIKDAESARDKAYTDLALYYDNVTSLSHQAAVAERKAAYKADTEFHKDHQLAPTRREFDLYDPEYLKKSLPARVGDDDPRLSVSGAQLFAGEDLGYKQRMKDQKEQIATWSMAQQAENGARRQMEADIAANDAHDQYMQTVKMNQLEAAKNQARKDALDAQLAFQSAQSQEKADKESAWKAAQLAADEAEKEFTLASDLMTEDPITGVSMLAPWRSVPYNFKGMSPEQVAAVRAGQAQQVAEKQQAASVAAHLAATQNATLQTLTSQFGDADEAAKAQRRANNIALAAEHKRQAEEKAARDKALATLYTNEPQEDYHMQFGTSAR